MSKNIGLCLLVRCHTIWINCESPCVHWGNETFRCRDSDTRQFRSHLLLLLQTISYLELWEPSRLEIWERRIYESAKIRGTKMKNQIVDTVASAQTINCNTEEINKKEKGRGRRLNEMSDDGNKIDYTGGGRKKSERGGTWDKKVLQGWRKGTMESETKEGSSRSLTGCMVDK